MTISKIAVYITLFLCFACESGKEVTPEIILPEPSSLEKILTRGSLEISTFYNTTDYYVYRGITRGFHYDLARDFAGYLGVNLRIVEVNNDIDTAIGRLQSGKYDLLAVSLTQTPERNEQLRFSKPLFQTREVLVQNKNSQPIKDMAQLDGKEIYIPKSATSYKKVLQQIQDSLNIHIYITEIEHYSYEDLLHLVETGEINYTVIDENIAQASSYSMKNLDIALKLKEDISVSWATHSDASLLSSEINNWLEEIRKYLEKKNPPAILPIQIAYYAGLRIGETCGLTWQDINLEEQCLTIKRSIRYDGMKHKNIIGPTKRKKVRIVDFGDTLTEILKAARKEQLKNRMQYGELYHRNYYKEVHVKNRVYYEYYHLDGTQEVPTDYKEISFVCLRPDGSLELPSTLSIVCRSVAKKLEGFEDFHFHQLRHTYTSNLLSNGAAPKDVQELLGHSDVSTTMNIYAHSTRKAKRDSARLLDKVASNA